MQAGSNAPTETRFAVGDVVMSDPDGAPGAVVEVTETTLGVVWSDGDGGKIIYPMDATYLRKAMPWEL